jgi:hypothetical protein
MNRNALMAGFDMPEGSDPTYGQQMMPSAALSSYQPTWRDRLASMFMPDGAASPERNRLIEGLFGSRGLGNTGIGAVDALPGVGQVLQAQEAVRSGDTDMLAMALMPGSKQVKAATGAADDAAKTGIRAYHGSPHDFDRFDMSKIGTGEGAQAYGHGLYFAEAEDVAKQYRQNLSRADGGIDQIAQTLVAQSGGDWKKALEKFEGDALNRVRSAKAAGLNYELPPYDVATLQALRKGEPGRTYEVRINADPDDFLDWDKPLSQQSEKVRGAAESALGYKPDIFRGDEFVRALELERGGNAATGTVDRAAATAALRDAGIPGIRYLDQGSRTAGEGSRNYVVFRDDIIDIVKKYGIAAAASMYGIDAVSQAMSTGQTPDNPLMQGF